ncbi:hypothetical protein QBC35DRAFT_386543 [Podospora australis]|uniref:Uncharacterized protein n=1 Tax=Podospora australis TaxID=1536484 RepID=A0AAN7AI15_9PEZI|nr:hypothetical protein QBC35DRAFT_386543 [Podospora australis]
MGKDDKTKAQRGRKRWTEEEDAILHDEAMKQSSNGTVRDWHRIATKLPGRTNKDCRKRWVNKVCGGLKKGLWDPEEDQRLQAAVEKHGLRWPLIAAEVGFRSPDQCSKRWQYGLDPRLKHREWTSEEDQLLLQLVQERGREWKAIQHNHYPSRSRIDLKNRYTILMRRLSNSTAANAAEENPDPYHDDDDDDGSDSSSVASGSDDGATTATDGASTGTAPTSLSGSKTRKGHSKNSSISSEPTSAMVQQQHRQQQHNHLYGNTDWLGSAMYNAGLESGSIGQSHLHVDPVVQDATMGLGFTFDTHVAVTSALGQEILTSAWDDPFSATPTAGGLNHHAGHGKSIAGYHHQLDMASFGSSSMAAMGEDGDVDMGMQVTFNPEMLNSNMTGGSSSETSGEEGGPSQIRILGSGEQTEGAEEDEDLSKVVIAVEGCDKDTLDYLFNVTRPIKGRVKMEITM